MLRKFCYSLAALMSTAAAVVAQPANDHCGDATMLTENVTMPFDITGATNTPAEVPSSCLLAALNTRIDVWFKYTATASGAVSILAQSNPSPSFSPNLVVFDACGGSVIACDGINGPTFNRVVVPVTSGQTIYVRLAPRSNTIGSTGTITVSPPVLIPANDECANAQDISTGQTLQFSNLGATNSSFLSCEIETARSFDVWFRYVPTQTGTAIFSTCGSAAQVRLQAFNDTCDASLLCGSTAECGSATQGFMPVPVTVGVPVRVRVSAFTSLVGSGQIHVELATPPTNNLCTNATELVPGVSQQFNLYSATNTAADVVNSCLTAAQKGAPDVWYSYMPTATGVASVFVGDPSPLFAPNVSVYDACGGGNLLGCARGNVGTYNARVAFPVTLGQTVYIRVGRDNNSGGLGTIQIDGPSAPLPNDTCAGAIDIANGETINFSNLLATNSNLATCDLPATNDNFDVWYRFVPNRNGEATFSTCDSGTTSFRLTVFSDFCGAPLECGTTCPGGLAGSAGIVSLSVTADEAVIVRVSAASGFVGSGKIRVDLPCPADFNGDSVRDVADLFGFINAWLAKTANADFNHDSVVDVADLFGFINAWLAGC